jgi:hypothetical protein
MVVASTTIKYHPRAGKDLVKSEETIPALSGSGQGEVKNREFMK